MTQRSKSNSFIPSALFGLLFLFPFLCAPNLSAAEPSAAAVATFNSYIGSLEARLARQHGSANGFLVPLSPTAQSDARLRRGDLIIETINPSKELDLPGAMLFHWRGSAFAPGATAADFERLMRNFNGYPQHYPPQVIRAKVLSQQGDRYQAVLRVSQHHVITVVMDTAYEITFGKLDAKRGYSLARSTRIDEISSPGTANEHALSPSEQHGLLWRLNTYWTYEERDGGLYMQLESVSLTRNIPSGFAWALRPFVESVPRESLEFTLRSTCNALRR